MSENISVCPEFRFQSSGLCIQDAGEENCPVFQEVEYDWTSTRGSALINLLPTNVPLVMRKYLVTDFGRLIHPKYSHPQVTEADVVACATSMLETTFEKGSTPYILLEKATQFWYVRAQQVTGSCKPVVLHSITELPNNRGLVPSAFKLRQTQKGDREVQYAIILSI